MDTNNSIFLSFYFEENVEADENIYDDPVDW